MISNASSESVATRLTTQLSGQAFQWACEKDAHKLVNERGVRYS